MTITTCRSCGAAVIWTHTPKGSLMPLDADPDPAGLIFVSDDCVAYVASGPDLFGGPRYVSHFATCPDSERWRN